MGKTEVLYFSAPWCAPCKAFLPEVEMACKMQGIQLTVYNVHTDVEATQLYNVNSVPTLIICIDDEMRYRSSKVLPRQYLIDELQRLEDEYGNHKTHESK